MADNWNNIGNLAERLHNAPIPVQHAYNHFIATSDGSYESEKSLELLLSFLREAFKLDFNSRSMVGIRLQQLNFQTLTPSTPTPEEVFNEPDSGMKIIIERPAPKKEQELKQELKQKQEQELKPEPKQEQKKSTPPPAPVKKTFEEIYENNIEKVCKTHKKDLETAYKIVNEKCNRPYTMLCKHANNCYKKQFCWFAHSKKEQDDANNAYIKTLKDYYSDQSEYIEFINGFMRLFGKDWEAYGLMLSCHKNGRIPYDLCTYGNRCNRENCTYNHSPDEKYRFFEKYTKIFEEIQFVKQPEEED